MKTYLQSDKQSVYTLPETITTISLHLYGNLVWVRRIITSNDENYSRCLDWALLYDGKDYDAALQVYNQACAAQSFLPDNKCSESGQAGILFILLIIAVIVCLYIAYTGISALTGNVSMFDKIITSLSEVLR